MAVKKSSKRNWQENYASIILGAIIVVILGLLVANFLTNRNGSILDNGTEDTITTDENNQTQEMTQSQEYTVKANDSLSKIADQVYGDQAMWPVLARENNISNPNVIFVDNKLKIPAKEEASKIQQEMTVASYEVQSGDTLFLIAEKVYGDGSQWGRIATANNIGRLPNGNPLIFAGSNLTIPR